MMGDFYDNIIGILAIKNNVPRGTFLRETLFGNQSGFFMICAFFLG